MNGLPQVPLISLRSLALGEQA